MHMYSMLTLHTVLILPSSSTSDQKDVGMLPTQGSNVTFIVHWYMAERHIELLFTPDYLFVNELLGPEDFKFL